LHYGIDEWDELPWWQKTVYVEGMAEELSGGGGEREDEDPYYTGERTQVLDLDEDGFDALTQFGMQVQAV
jgi:hypothetical protein